MDSSTFFIASFDEELTPASQFPSELQAEAPEGPAGEIRLATTATGCVLMLEALVLALGRQIPIKEAAVVVRGCNTPLWLVVEAKPDSDNASFDGSDSKERNRQNLLDYLDEALAQEKEQSGDVEGVLPSAAEAMPAVEAALSRAGGAALGIFGEKCRRGEVRSESALLCSSQSRAPPQTVTWSVRRQAFAVKRRDI
ncbi:MAG TPA: hypothetical protein DCZ75_05050 [Geobacter sp.]|nr:hypothetical protein [Geobacter sp.]